ncbi:MAG: hypothetical protein KDJ29_00765 [Hyphomicrobiales bacterium]|nr:hypothetical protein [Hyphomicrobiales bacterium]
MIRTDALATLLGVSSSKVRDLTRRGVLQQVPGSRAGTYNLIETVNAYTAHLREGAAGRNIGDEILRLKTAKLRADALKATLQAQSLQGSVIPRTEIAGRWISTARIIRSTLLSIPARAAARLNLSASAREELEAEIHAALEDLADNGLEQVEILEYREANNDGRDGNQSGDRRDDGGVSPTAENAGQ